MSSVDLVYTWVDGAAPGYRKRLESYALTPEDRNPERTRDLYQVLRRSLRSVERFAPWVRDVYLVTARPQVPAWLDLANPRVHVVHHEEIPGFEPYLPTFNPNAIESFLHLVPGVSDPFLYCNDDYLFGAPTSLEDFVTPDGRIHVHGTVWGERLPFRVYDERWNVVSLGALEHVPLLVYGSHWRDMLAAREADLHRTRARRFRHPDDLRMERLYRQHLLGLGRRVAMPVPAHRLLRYCRFHKVDNDPRRQARGLERLRRARPKLYCLNDDQRERPDQRVVQMVRAFLEEYYPERSTFEVPAP